MKLKILEVNMSRKKDANKYWIYGEDAALAAQFTAYLATVLKNRRLTYSLISFGLTESCSNF